LSSEVEYEGVLASTVSESIQPTEHFGEECVLGPNARSSTVKAITDCLVLEISSKEIMDVAKRNGPFLAMLNQETRLSKMKNLEGKHNLSKPAKVPLKKSSSKKPLTSSIQTFFTDLFPSSSSSKK
jgi:CRP-like cAMP-binding protein